MKNSYDLTNFNTFGERSSITTTDTDLLLNTDSKRAVVIVDQDPFEFALSNFNGKDCYSMHCLKLLQDCMKNNFLFTSFSEIESTLEMIIGC